MGKSSIMYVVGLGILLMYYVMAISNTSTQSLSGALEYHTRTTVHNAAVAGANIGTHNVLMGTDTSATFTGVFMGAPFSVVIDNPGPGGTRRVASVASLEFELRDGYGTIRDTVIALFRHIQFARYGYFSGAEVNGYMSAAGNGTPGGSMWKVTGDSMFGYAHTNTRWNLGGRPYFDSKVTAFNPPNSMIYGGVYDPIFNGGTQWGITVNRPVANLTNLQNQASASFPSALISGNDLGLEFFADGSVHVTVPAIVGSSRNDTVPLSSLTTTGVIAVTGGDIRVRGTYKGAVTLAALSGSAPTKGNIWIDGDLVASNDPRADQTSTDMLGLVAERMAYVTTKNPITGTLIPRDASSITRVQAAIYTQNGVFAAEDYDTVPVSGRIALFGSLTMNASTSTGVLGGGTLAHGFLKSIRHDDRFLTTAPPGFPASDKYELLSWWED
jgi:hypothetical protein